MTSSKDTALSQLNRLESLLVHDPLNESLLEAAFASALETGEWINAEKHLNTGKKICKNSLPWALREGDLLLSMKKIDQAEELFLSLNSQAELPSEFGHLLIHNLAHIDYLRKNYPEASRKLREIVIQRNPHQLANVASFEINSTASPSTLRLLLRTLHHAGDLSEALAIVEKIRPNQKLFLDVASIASAIALDFNQENYAREWSNVAIDSSLPENRKIEAFVVKASLLLGDGDISGSKNYASRALDINPTEGRAYSVLGFVALSSENLTEAEDFFKKSLQCNFQHIGTLLGLGWTELLGESIASAIDSFSAAVELDRNFGESHGALAVALVLAGNRELARDTARRGLKLDPLSPSSLFAIAILDGEITNRASLLRFSKQVVRQASSGANSKTSRDSK
ncbi:tetratricopeptide repeat protein [Acidovorax facilis]|uniref:tetratricopeptide repeat protein n=1 Tax=Acidovorax facilis TaxID=12917 RepID=UPI003CF7F68B